MAVVDVEGVDYAYPGASRLLALRNITMAVGNNEFVSVIGPSGCGKSTLLRLIANLLEPSRGRISIDGAPNAAARRQRDIGFVFQEPALMPWRRALGNVRLPLEIIRAATHGHEDPAALLRLVGLADFATRYPRQLSGGMRQRVSIARALTYAPRVLLMDEPFGALDKITRDEMNLELLKIWETKKTTVIFVTHDLTEAVFLSDRIVVLSPRPGSIQDIVDVTLPRPRALDVRRTPEFFALETRVLGLLEGRLMTSRDAATGAAPAATS
jgi:NitT/TauT family transport system ATP-binding protein